MRLKKGGICEQALVLKLQNDARMNLFRMVIATLMSCVVLCTACGPSNQERCNHIAIGKSAAQQNLKLSPSQSFGSPPGFAATGTTPCYTRNPGTYTVAGPIDDFECCYGWAKNPSGVDTVGCHYSKCAVDCSVTDYANAQPKATGFEDPHPDAGACGVWVRDGLVVGVWWSGY